MRSSICCRIWMTNSATIGEMSRPARAAPTARRIGARIGSVTSKIQRARPAGSGSWTHDRITRAKMRIVSASAKPSTNVRRKATKNDGEQGTLPPVHATRDLVEPVAGRRRPPLILVAALQSRRTVWLLRRRGHGEEGDLADTHAAVQRDR